ncbi:MAG: trigger factor [Patescibacteria group bacterium]|nr:trigger factor [Patescibacteria group bacterium]
MNQATVKKLPKSEVELKIKVPKEKIGKYLDRAASDYSKKNTVAGFRPGKAPREAVERQTGKQKLLESALDLLVKETYIEALVDNKIEALGPPKIEVEKFGEDNDFLYTARVAVFPKITLGDVRKMGIKKAEIDKIKVAPEELEQAIKQLRLMRAKLITVNREARKGDRAEVDFKLFMGKAPYEGGSSTNHPIVIGEGKFIPGFEEKLIGMKRDEKKKFELVFPKKYYDQKIQGKKGEFEVTMKLVQKQELPELNDDFARSLGRFKDLGDFKKAMEKNLKAEKKTREINAALDKALAKIVENTRGEIPKIMIEDEKQKMLAELEVKVRQMGLEMEKYLNQVKKTKEELVQSWDQDAKKRIKAGLAIREIANREKIKAGNEEIEARTQKLLSQLDQRSSIKNVDQERARNYAKGLIVNDKVLEWLKKEILEAN